VSDSETSDALVRQPAAQPPADPRETQLAPTGPKKSRRPWVIGGIVLAVLGLAAAGTAAFVLLTPSAAAGPASAVLGYDQAYAEVDCELFVAVTTDTYREALAPTCDDFETEAQAFVDSFSDYVVIIETTDIDGATATISTTESWVLEGQENTAEYLYTLVNEGGAWKIDALE
jgi:hypothetical protein